VHVVVFHSMFGLRAVELAAAERLRGEGYAVIVPDLFGGATASGDAEQGFALMSRVGWPTIADRARRAVADVPDEAVLAGFSMGVGVIGEVWPERLNAAAVLCFHAPTIVPVGVPAGTPVQLHVGAADRQFASEEQIASFSDSAQQAGTDTSIHRYPGAGHFFTDRSSPDHHAEAATLAWTRALRFLHAVHAIYP
jgi:dienelactone hydrolase